MFRHLSQWSGYPATTELLLLLLGMAALTLITGILVFFSVRTLSLSQPPQAWAKAAIAFVAMLAILAFYPENIIAGTVGELFTVVVGAFLLFAPLWALGYALIPYTQEKRER